MAVETRLRVPTEEIAEHAGDVDRAARFPSESIEALKDEGLLALGIPPELNGGGGGPLELVDAIEQVSSACASTGMVYTMHLVAVQTMLAGANEGEAMSETLSQIAAGRHLTTLAYSETGSRSHFWAQVSRARPAAGGVVIDADKSWVTSAGWADSYLTATGAVGGTSALETELYLVDAASPGIEVQGAFDGLGMCGNASAPVRLRGVEVAEERRLGEAGSGFGLMLSATLPWFVLGCGACCAGMAGGALAIACEHAAGARFEHLGSTLAELPTIRARLADAKVRHMQARALLYEVAEQIERGDERAQIGVLAVKAACAEMAIDVTDQAMRVCGGAAFSRHLPVERYFRDARAATVMAPTTDVLRDLLGKAITGQDLF